MYRVIERILNLLAYLLTVGRPVTGEEIRQTVAGYDQGSDEAWRRMFERDKDLLRRMGIPLQMQPLDRWGAEAGYVVSPDQYSLPDPGLTDEERAALWLASQVVRFGERPVGDDALLKLGGAPTSLLDEPLAADLGAQDDALAETFLAVSERRTLHFRYNDTPRTVAPYGLVHRRGHWYVVGPEDGAPAPKVFRLDRAGGLRAGDEPAVFTRPEGFDASAAVPDAPWEAGAAEETAVVRFDAELSWWARRQLTRRAEVTEEPDGSLTVTLPVGHPDAFVGWVLGFDDRAVIVSPPELRRRLLDRVAAA